MANTTLSAQRKLEITISLPTFSFEEFKKKMNTLFSNIYNPMSSSISSASDHASSRARRIKFPKGDFKFDKKYFKIILPIVVAVVVIGGLVKIVSSLPDAKSKPVESTSQTTAPDALSTINLDRTFSFPLKDDKGASVGSFEYVIQSASIQKQIIVQGQRATAVKGREFLILNLKLTNKLKKSIQLNTRDYIRIVNASTSNEQLAPDIHNDPVEVQAISTKFTRIGIALDESAAKKTIQLKVGEIDGTKQNIDLNFKY